MRPEPAIILAASVLVIGVGCESSPEMVTTIRTDVVSSPAPAGAAAPPMDVQGVTASPLEYLVGKYDRDGDGRVSSAEYDRAGGRFDRLDRNSDGVLDTDDYSDDGGGGMAGGMRAMRGQMIVVMYFQDDDDGDRLSLDELRRSATAYDADDDGAISRTEFDALADDRRTDLDGPEMMRRMMRQVEPFDALLATADEDSDEQLAEDELVAFFNDRDDGDGVWTMNRGAGSRPTSRPMSGAPEGDMAPDFALRPPGGGEAVALSSFRNNLPVALIFGSYT